MKYKNMAKCMTEEEIQTALWILVMDGMVTGIRRLEAENEIEVTFYLDASNSQKEYTITLGPEKPLVIPEELETTGDTYRYQQFMTAKGYHPIWLGNVFA